jgi:hypothetical protein
MKTGFKCECGTYHEFPGYVFAHWAEAIIHTCQCKRRHEIVEGTAVLLDRRAK